MYKIRNITLGKVILGDLGIVFNHGEEKDLDQIFSRTQIDWSQNLKAAIHYGKLSVPLKDDPEPAATTTFFMPPTEVTPDHLSDMEKRIKSHLEQYMKTQNPKASAPGPEVQQKLDAILNLLAQGGAAPQATTGETETVEDDDKLIDIQMRALQRITKNAEGQIAAKEERKDSSVSDRADELEGLL